MKSFKTLVFFTLHYPYGTKSETFIENEIEYLADHFKKVIIIPRQRDGNLLRPIPSNAEVNNMFVNNEVIRNHYSFLLKKPAQLIEASKIYIFTLLNDKKRWYYLKGGYFIYYLVNALNDAAILQKFLKKNDTKDYVFYDYWFLNSSLALAHLRSKNLIPGFVCRAHRFDVFDDLWKSGSIPFREYILKNIDKVFPISEYNKRYMDTQINQNHEKLEVAYLGVQDFGGEVIHNEKETKLPNKAFTIVSCANLLPRKQVPKIAEVLKTIPILDIRIKWVHFGNGACEEELFTKASELPSYVEFVYKGHVENQVVLNFYKEHPVDLFISLSVKEGLPVSMMEAQSFGIPIIAYKLFGMPEIINIDTGILLNPKMKNPEIGQYLEKILIGKIKFDKKKIYAFFLNNFSAANNYPNFVSKLQ